MDEIDRLLLQSFPTEAPGATTTELIAALARAGHDLTARAVQKRLASLEERHDLVCERSGKPYRWSIDARVKRALLAPMLPHEALALALADEYLAPILPPRSRGYIRERLVEVERALEQEHGQRSKRWKEKVRRVTTEIAREKPRLDPGVFMAISEALDEGLVVEVDYRKRWAAEPSRRRLHPLGLLERSDALWLVARDEDEAGELGEIKQFVLHRMRRVRALRGVLAKPPAHFSLDRFIREGHPHFRLGEDVDLVVRFRADVADRLEEAPLASGQTIEDAGEGFMRLRARVPYTRALVTFLTSYGSFCVVEAPRALREAVYAELRTATRNYERR